MTTRTKKVYFQDLAAHDNAKSDSTIRLLEMTVDSVVPEMGYSIQFWRDVRLYGVDEAIMYLKDHVSTDQYIKLETTWNSIKEKL
jgi:hypothetical protein